MGEGVRRRENKKNDLPLHSDLSLHILGVDRWSTCIELDTTSCSKLRLPAEKICQLLDILEPMEGEEAVSEEGAILSLIGRLSHACKILGWQDLLEEDDRDRQDSSPAKSLGTPQLSSKKTLNGGRLS